MAIKATSNIALSSSVFECLPSIKLRAKYLRTSSNRMTGNDIFSTAHHSNIVNGHNEKTTWVKENQSRLITSNRCYHHFGWHTERMSTYKTTKCNVIDKVIAAISHTFVHGGMANNDWFSDKLIELKHPIRYT